MKVAAVVLPSYTANRSAHLAVTAEIMLIANRWPVPCTTGVRPTGAHVVPEYQSEPNLARRPNGPVGQASGVHWHHSFIAGGSSC
jgi:hypothetical protein